MSAAARSLSRSCFSTYAYEDGSCPQFSVRRRTRGQPRRTYRSLCIRQLLPFGTHQPRELACVGDLRVRDRAPASSHVAEGADGPNPALGSCFLILSLHSIVKSMYGERAFFGASLSFLRLVFLSYTHTSASVPPISPRVKYTGTDSSAMFARRWG